MSTPDPVETSLRIYDALVREVAAADAAATQAERASSYPDADTEAGRLRGYAQGLQRALAMLGDAPV